MQLLSCQVGRGTKLRLNIPDTYALGHLLYQKTAKANKSTKGEPNFWMNIKEIDASSPGNTCTNQWQSMMSGLIPFLSYEPVRQTPRADLVKTIREYVNSGLKPQQEIAREIGLSRTKMSQFMNGAKRVKGWREVESKLDKWIKEFKKSKKTAHIRFLDNRYTEKLITKPARPAVENLYKQPCILEEDSSSHMDVKISDVCLDDLLTLNSSETELPDMNYTNDIQNQVNSRISSVSKERDIDLSLDSVDVEDNWSQFEIGRVLSCK